jgi:hypothetical protein
MSPSDIKQILIKALVPSFVFMIEEFSNLIWESHDAYSALSLDSGIELN